MSQIISKVHKQIIQIITPAGGPKEKEKQFKVSPP